MANRSKFLNNIKLALNFKLYGNSKSEFTPGSDRICFFGKNDFKEDFTCTNNLSRFLWKILTNIKVLSCHDYYSTWKFRRIQNIWTENPAEVKKKISSRCCKLNKSSIDWIIFGRGFHGRFGLFYPSIKKTRFHQKST